MHISLIAGTLPDNGIPVVRRGRKATGQAKKPDSRVTERRGRSLPGNKGLLQKGRSYAFATGGDSPLDFEFHARAGGRLLPGGHHRDPCSTGRNPDASWTAPTSNVDSSPLTDLSAYRVYYGVSGSSCPGPSYLQVASPTSSPASGTTVNARLTGLTDGSLYYVAVTAVNTSGNESACPTSSSAVARVDFSVSPAATVDFGTVPIGSFADQTFTVQNTSGGTVSGTASVSAPFSIVSGGTFSAVGTGGTQTVTARFTPPSLRRRA